MVGCERRMKDIVIVGKGGFAKETKWIIDRINYQTLKWNFLGYVDRTVGEVDVIGDDRYILNIKKQLSIVLAIGDPKIRNNIYLKYKQNKFLEFPNLIDPSVKMSESAYLGEGNIICADSIMTVDVSLGNFNIINLDCTIGHDVKIGDFNTINPGSNISGNVVFKDFIEIGTGSKIIQGITIEKGVIAGAGSVIISDVPAEATVVGVPAKVIKYHEKDK